MNDLLVQTSDPAKLGWPPTLPVEIALQEQSVKDICQSYEISRAYWNELRVHPVFAKAVADAVDMLQREGTSFRVKAGMQAVEYLKTSWLLVHSPNEQVPASVKADLIKFTVNAAGLNQSISQKAGATAGALVNALQININLR